MYKVEEFFGKPEELEEYLNKKCVVEHLTISQMVSPVRNSYSIIFYDWDESKKRNIDCIIDNLMDEFMDDPEFYMNEKVEMDEDIHNALNQYIREELSKKLCEVC